MVGSEKLTMRIDEILPAVAGIAARAVAGLAKTAVKKGVQAVGKAAVTGARTAGTIAKNLKPKSVGTNMIGRTANQNKGTGGEFSGNPPKTPNSLSSIGAMPGAKTSSVGSTDRPGTKDTIGTTPPQSAADMRNSASNDTTIGPASTYSTGTQDLETTQSNDVEPDELKTGDTLTVKVEPGNKNVKLVYPDETEAEVPRELLRLQQLAGMQ
jgi:hypothetical protein